MSVWSWLVPPGPVTSGREGASRPARGGVATSGGMARELGRRPGWANRGRDRRAEARQAREKAGRDDQGEHDPASCPCPVCGDRQDETVENEWQGTARRAKAVAANEIRKGTRRATRKAKARLDLVTRVKKRHVKAKKRRAKARRERAWKRAGLGPGWEVAPERYSNAQARAAKSRAKQRRRTRTRGRGGR